MRIGESAPDFNLKDGADKSWKLSDQLGKIVVLLFYPGDNTPVCTKQMCSARDSWEDYQKTGAEVVGISTDSVQSHYKFAEKYDLPMTLLSDENAAVSAKYGASSWISGRAARAVVVIGKDGKIAYHKVQPLGVFRPSDDEVLAAIKASEK